MGRRHQLRSDIVSTVRRTEKGDIYWRSSVDPIEFEKVDIFRHAQSCIAGFVPKLTLLIHIMLEHIHRNESARISVSLHVVVEVLPSLQMLVVIKHFAPVEPVLKTGLERWGRVVAKRVGEAVLASPDVEHTRGPVRTHGIRTRQIRNYKTDFVALLDDGAGIGELGIV